MIPARPERWAGWASILRAALPWAGLVAITAAVIGRFDVDEIGRALSTADPAWIAVAWGGTLLAVVLVAGKVQLVLAITGAPSPWRRCASAVLASATLNAVLPGRGGDLVRGAFLAEKHPLLVVLGAVMVERLVDLLALGLLAVGANLGRPWGFATWIGLAVAGAAFTLIAVLARLGRLPGGGPRTEQAGIAAGALLARPMAGAALVALSMVCWLENAAVLAACTRASGAEVLAYDVIRAAPVAILAGIVPVTASGLGTRDVALVAALPATDTPERILAGSLIYAALMYGGLAVLGLALLRGETVRMVGRLRASPHEASS